MRWRARQGILIAAAFGAALIVTVMTARENDSGPGAAGESGRARPGTGQSTLPLTDLRLEVLRRDRPDLTPAERDPFRFQARRERSAPPAAVSRTPPPRPVAVAPSVPAGPPPPPPIPLKFIGLVEAPTQAGRVAILSDGRGNVVYGKEGDTIEGQYRLLRVGPDAVEMAYVDGKGRQTVRLAGQ